MIKVYENKLKEIEDRKTNLERGIENIKKVGTNFETALNVVLDFLGNPYLAWQNGNLVTKKTVLKLLFRNKLPISKEKGFETASLPLILRLFEVSGTSKSRRVEMAALKPRPN